jgi:hypothetical protein
MNRRDFFKSIGKVGTLAAGVVVGVSLPAKAEKPTGPIKRKLLWEAAIDLNGTVTSEHPKPILYVSVDGGKTFRDAGVVSEVTAYREEWIVS